MIIPDEIYGCIKDDFCKEFKDEYKNMFKEDSLVDINSYILNTCDSYSWKHTLYKICKKLDMEVLYNFGESLDFSEYQFFVKELSEYIISH